VVDAVMDGTKWVLRPKESSSGYSGKSSRRYLSISSGIAKSVGNDNPFSDEPGLADGLISRLHRRYEFRGGLALENFLRENLRENEHLGGLLLEAYEVIRDLYGPGTRVALEVVADPDAPGNEELFVLIRSRFPPKVARALLSALDQGWWRNASPTARGKLELDVE
jgi:hypothetical protein